MHVLFSKQNDESTTEPTCTANHLFPFYHQLQTLVRLILVYLWQTINTNCFITSLYVFCKLCQTTQIITYAICPWQCWCLIAITTALNATFRVVHTVCIVGSSRVSVNTTYIGSIGKFSVLTVTATIRLGMCSWDHLSDRWSWRHATIWSRSWSRRQCPLVIKTKVFTARCTLVQSAVLRSHVVCLSIRPSVRLWRWWIVIT